MAHKCKICGFDYYSAGYTDPEEPCVCGEGLTHDSPWAYDGWNGIRNWLRYRVANVIETTVVRFFNWFSEWAYGCYKPRHREQGRHKY